MRDSSNDTSNETSNKTYQMENGNNEPLLDKSIKIDIKKFQMNNDLKSNFNLKKMRINCFRNISQISYQS